MLIRTRCDHCRTIAEVSKINLDKIVICSRCGRQYVARAQEDTDTGVIALAEEEPDVQAAALEVRTGGRLVRHSLSLLPPPAEDWNLVGDEDAETVPRQRFARFRPRRKELEPFLHPERTGDDNAVFLVAGLVACAVIGAIFFVVVLILCFVI